MGCLLLGHGVQPVPQRQILHPLGPLQRTPAEARKDEAWYAALGKVADKYGGYICNGDGDPCDIFFVMKIGPETAEATAGEPEADVYTGGRQAG